ncbi:GIY-YIG nuclease family protein [Actinotignum schaalii]|nr:GIY-YIG nuclease family protein [Actinotignum schaalii]
MARGKAIELFLVDGTPGGIMTASIADWTGVVVSARRDQLSELLRREDAHGNGVYLLLGADPDAIDNTWCYIGKTENFSERLRTHDQRKPQWNRVVIIGSMQKSFNEGHWGYLESRLVDIAQAAERCSMPDNKQVPRLRKLSEGQQASAESFLDNVKVILPILGVNVLRSRSTIPAAPAPETPAATSTLFHLRQANKGVDATMQLVDGEYFVLKGSRVVAEWHLRGASESTLRSYTNYAALHHKLVDDGSIKLSDGTAVLTRDIAFGSPSTAAAVILGRSSNGRREWLADDGRTFGEWEADNA